MAWTFRGGKLLFNGGKVVTNDNCCCDNCLENCDDASISVTLPAFTTPLALAAVPNLSLPNLSIPELALPAFDGVDCGCDDIAAGPWTLDSWAGDEQPGCCYWRNIVGGGDVTAIYAVLCIVDDVATLTVTVECASGTIHEFSREYQLCDLCTSLPGSVSVDPVTGDCDTSDPATIEFTTECCYVGECDCPHHACDDDTEFNVNITGTGDWSFINYDETVSAECVTYGETGSDGVNPVVAIGVKHTFEKTVVGCTDPIKIIVEMYLLCNYTSGGCVGRKNTDMYLRITAYQQSCEAIVAQINQGSIGQLEGCDSCWSRDYEDVYGDTQPVEVCLASNSPVAWVGSVGVTLKWATWIGSCNSSILGILHPDDGGSWPPICSESEIADCESDDNFGCVDWGEIFLDGSLEITVTEI